MGRSRGGLTTKIHALVDGQGLPIWLHLSEGQASDCRQADPALEAVPKGSTFLYRYRNLIERFFGKIKHARGIATRYDKRADNFMAALKLLPVRLWIKANESTAYTRIGTLS